MNHLAVDTATEILSVALRIQSGGRDHVLTETRDQGLKHTGKVMVLVDRLLHDAGIGTADLNMVSCMRGPGSFTGLRIGMSTAKGIGWAIAGSQDLDRPPVVSVPTLDAMAATVSGRQVAIIVPVIDGRKQRFYTAAFHNGDRLTPDLDLEPNEIVRRIARVASEAGFSAVPWTVTGPHAPAFLASARESVAEVLGGNAFVDPGHRAGWARSILDLAERQFDADGADSIDTGPEYLRLSEAEESLRDKGAQTGSEGL